MQGGRAASFLDLVRKQDTATTGVASIEDAAEYGERADALVSDLLGRVMRQRRTVAVAMDYIRALSRRDAGELLGNLPRRPGMRGRTGCRPCSAGINGRGRSSAGCCGGWRRKSCAMTPAIPPGRDCADLRKGKFTACVSPQHAGVTGKVWRTA